MRFLCSIMQLCTILYFSRVAYARAGATSPLLWSSPSSTTSPSSWSSRQWPKSRRTGEFCWGTFRSAYLAKFYIVHQFQKLLTKSRIIQQSRWWWEIKEKFCILLIVRMSIFAPLLLISSRNHSTANIALLGFFNFDIDTSSHIHKAKTCCFLFDDYVYYLQVRVSRVRHDWSEEGSPLPHRLGGLQHHWHGWVRQCVEETFVFCYREFQPF